MNNRKNFFSALVYQSIHIVYGLVVPRIIILYFGSGVNGLVSSITQFLSFISLLEGGLGAVVLAELYKPIECRDTNTVGRILKSSQAMFNTISFVYVLYTIVLGIIYAFTSANSFSFAFVFSLTIILAMTTLAEYLFSITYRLFLQADQKIYITNYLSAGILGVNIIVAFVSVKIYPEIRILKLLSSIAFFVQPLILRCFIPRELKNRGREYLETYNLSNRWSGFAQNLAHFINMNTDVILITVFSSYSEVSVYTVYMLAINALRLVIVTVANSYQSALGKYIAQGDITVLKQKFYKFSILLSGISTLLFCTCLLLINQFVNIYTTSVNDANYFRPIFAFIILVANLVYCLREPYRLLILAAGKFKETNSGAVLEAVLNICISVLLIKPFGLVGVAIGTLIAITYRFVYFVCFLKKNIINIKVRKTLLIILPMLVLTTLNAAIYFLYSLEIKGMLQFVLVGMVTVVIEGGATYILYKFIDRFFERVKD